MKNITEIINDLLPAIIVAIVTSGVTTVSIQGFKNFFKVELKGPAAQISTVVIAAVWSYILVIHYGQGSLVDFALNLTMTFLGATGIYEVLMQNKGDNK